MAAQEMTISVLSAQREKVGEILLPAVISEQPQREHLLFETVRMQLANRRSGTAATKTRAQVRGGGRKPWRQKGTGRARAGSNRSPIWVGGATVFGPQPRSYAYRMPRSARKTALRAALAQKLRQDEVVVIDAIQFDEPKTKQMVTLLAQLEMGDSVLLVLADADINVQKSARNLPGVKVLLSQGLNVYDLLRYRKVLVTQAAMQQVSERLGGE
ncbi:MAG: 50S ribosomal protein L4 [Desulfurellaceae bacterium]|nr:50S ribosomal protein L4 [Desulfurellaceae bacterium]